MVETPTVAGSKVLEPPWIPPPVPVARCVAAIGKFGLMTEAWPGATGALGRVMV
jgi:hypothetical protein